LADIILHKHIISSRSFLISRQFVDWSVSKAEETNKVVNKGINREINFRIISSFPEKAVKKCLNAIADAVTTIESYQNAFVILSAFLP
jgi:hypothetical protein